MKDEYKSYIQYAIGTLVGVAGIAFMFIPFIPVGYLLLFLALFILSPKIPFFKKIIRFLKKKDKKGQINKAEEKINDLEDKIDEHLSDTDENDTKP